MGNSPSSGASALDKASDPEFEKKGFGVVNNDSSYRHLAMELIFLCRFFVQAHEQSLNASNVLRE